MDLLKSFTCPTLVLVGHFGSGKTEIAVNLALALAAERPAVNLVDLDLVKPYFRCRLARDAVGPRGVRLVAPEGEYFHSDLPILMPEIAGLLQRDDQLTILDVGGDDTGARVLGALRGAIRDGQYELLLVVNARRPGTATAVATVAVLDEIEAAAHLRVTGLVSNTHLMAETTPAIVREGLALCREVTALTGRRTRFVCAEQALAPQLSDLDAPLLPLTRHIVPPFIPRPVPTRLAV